jgi:hypothetical protein
MTKGGIVNFECWMLNFELGRKRFLPAVEMTGGAGMTNGSMDGSVKIEIAFPINRDSQ